MEIDAGPIFVQLQGQAPAQIQPLFAFLAELYEKKYCFHLLKMKIFNDFVDIGMNSLLILTSYLKIHMDPL